MSQNPLDFEKLSADFTKPVSGHALRMASHSNPSSTSSLRSDLESEKYTLNTLKFPSNQSNDLRIPPSDAPHSGSHYFGHVDVHKPPINLMPKPPGTNSPPSHLSFEEFMEKYGVKPSDGEIATHEEVQTYYTGYIPTSSLKGNKRKYKTRNNKGAKSEN